MMEVNMTVNVQSKLGTLACFLRLIRLMDGEEWRAFIKVVEACSVTVQPHNTKLPVHVTEAFTGSLEYEQVVLPLFS